MEWGGRGDRKTTQGAVSITKARVMVTPDQNVEVKVVTSGGVLKDKPTGFIHLDVRREREDHARLQALWLEPHRCKLRRGNPEKKQACGLAVYPGETGNGTRKGKPPKSYNLNRVAIDIFS